MASQLINQLQQLVAKHGDFPITRLDGSPLDRIILDGFKPGEVIKVVKL